MLDFIRSRVMQANQGVMGKSWNLNMSIVREKSGVSMSFLGCLRFLLRKFKQTVFRNDSELTTVLLPRQVVSDFFHILAQAKFQEIFCQHRSILISFKLNFDTSSEISNLLYHLRAYPANIYLFKLNIKNTDKGCEVSLKLTMKTPDRRHLRSSGVFIVNFEHISQLFSSFFY